MKTRLKVAGGALGALGLAAVALIGDFEGLRTTAYRDVVGVPTVCFGETRGVKMGDTYTVDECRAMLGDGLVEFEQGMRACLTEPDTIPDGPYMAFLSLTYNVGQRALCRSTLVRHANAGRLRAACEELPRWNRAGGRVIKGLVNRRAKELEICLAGLDGPVSVAGSEGPPVPPTKPAAPHVDDVATVEGAEDPGNNRKAWYWAGSGIALLLLIGGVFVVVAMRRRR